MKRLCFLFSLLPSLLTEAQVTRIQAEDYISMSGVQVESTNDAGGGQHVGYIDAGDFMQYTITAPTTGMYRIAFRTASNNDQCNVNVLVDGEIKETHTMPNTGSFYVWQTSFSDAFTMSAGTHTIRLELSSSGYPYNINWFEFARSSYWQLPTASAGADKNIKTSVGNTTLTGSGTPGLGASIIHYTWTKMSGGAGTIVSPSAASTSVTGLAAGQHQFVLTVMNSNEVSATDTVRVNVSECGGQVHNINGINYFSTTAVNPLIWSGNPSSGFYYPIQPGDTLRVKDTLWAISLSEYTGTAACPIVITNAEGHYGVTKIGFDLYSIKHFELLGNADASIPYGLQVNGKGVNHGANFAVSIHGKSTNGKVKWMRIEEAGYAGQIKQDPACDTMFNYPNLILSDFEIAYTQAKSIGQDGWYLGNTDPKGNRFYICGGDTMYFRPATVENIWVHHNTLDSLGRTAIQLSGAKGSNLIEHNYVRSAGHELNPQQGTAISIGGMTEGTRVRYNTIRETFNYGIYDIGAGTNYIENNDIDSSGFLYVRRSSTGIMDSLVVNSGAVNILSRTDQTIPFSAKTIIIRNNRLGRNASSPFPAGDPLGAIAFPGWGPPDFTVNNIICGNTYRNGVTPASVFTFNGFVYKVVCHIIKNKITLPRGRFNFKSKQ